MSLLGLPYYLKLYMRETRIDYNGTSMAAYISVSLCGLPDSVVNLSIGVIVAASQRG